MMGGRRFCPVIYNYQFGTSHSGTDSLIQVISVASAEANSNDELQYANHMADAASSDLRLSAQRYTLLCEWLGIQEGAKKAFIRFHPLTKLTFFFSYCTCTDKCTPMPPTTRTVYEYGHVARYDFTPQVMMFVLFYLLHSVSPSNSLLPVSLLLLLHPFSVSHLKLLLLSVDSFARLKKKRSRITE